MDTFLSSMFAIKGRKD